MKERCRALQRRTSLAEVSIGANECAEANSGVASGGQNALFVCLISLGLQLYYNGNPNAREILG
jgi:hypothetical protein